MQSFKATFHKKNHQLNSGIGSQYKNDHLQVKSHNLQSKFLFEISMDN